MLERQDKPTAADPAALRKAMLDHQQAVIAGLKQTPNTERLFIPYPKLVTRPLEWCGKIAAFLQPMHAVDPALMLQAVKPERRRNIG